MALLSKWLETHRTRFCTENHALFLLFCGKEQSTKNGISLPEQPLPKLTWHCNRSGGGKLRESAWRGGLCISGRLSVSPTCISAPSHQPNTNQYRTTITTTRCEADAQHSVSFYQLPGRSISDINARPAPVTRPCIDRPNANLDPNLNPNLMRALQCCIPNAYPPPPMPETKERKRV